MATKASLSKKDTVEVIDPNFEQLKKENEELKNSMSDAMAMMAEMRKVMEDMKTQQSASVSVQVSDLPYKGEKVKIASNLFRPTTLSDRKDGENGIIVDPSKRVVGFAHERIDKILLRSKIRSFFEDGVLYFPDKKWYDVFDIEPKAILNDEYVSQLLELSNVEMITELNRITSKKTNSVVMHTLIYRIANLVKKGLVRPLNYEKTDLFKEYFGADIGAFVASLVLLVDSYE